MGRLVGPDSLSVPLERKGAALLAYLALEGPTPRSLLAGLLWPEVGEEGARNNLRQRLYRLRRLGVGLAVVQREFLALDDRLEVDLKQFVEEVGRGKYEEALSRKGVLLAYEYDDLPEFGEWLLRARGRLERLRHQARLGAMIRLERAGQYAGALALAEAWVEEDPLSEEAHRQVMRLCYLLGDRARALAAYHRCQEILRRELGLSPFPATVALARAIDKGLLEGDARRLGIFFWVFPRP